MTTIGLRCLKSPAHLLDCPFNSSFTHLFALLNPIQKLWRWLHHDVLSLHRLCDAQDNLKRRVLDFMAQFIRVHQPSFIMSACYPIKFSIRIILNQ
jgi:hypothetical protein